MRLFRAGERGFDQYLSEMDERIAQDRSSLEKEVRSILKDIRQRRDKALLHYTYLFDGVRLVGNQLEVEKGEIKRAYRKLSRDFLKTLV